jgi:sulfite oxidase
MKMRHSTAPLRTTQTRHVLSQFPLNIESDPSQLTEFITPLDSHFVRCHGNVPDLNNDDVKVTFSGLVEDEMTFLCSQLREMSCKKTITVTLACAGNRRAGLHEYSPLRGESSALLWQNSAISTAEYTGIPLTELLKMNFFKKLPSHIEFCGTDICHGKVRSGTYAVSIPFSHVDKVLLAFDMNGEPLRAEHGGPLRIICAGLVGARSCKWLTKVVFRDSPSTSKIQMKEYRWMDGSAIDEYPVNSCMTKLENGVLHGWAYVDGDRYISYVEVSIDGEDWIKVHENNITPVVQFVWRLWYIQVPKGAKVFYFRAVDNLGNVQPTKPVWNSGGYIANHIDRWTCKL